MYKNFIQAITWNSINLFLYKIILLIHQITLFKFIPKELYGTSGTLFATIYFLIGITGFGFDYSLLSFFSNYQESKREFAQLAHQYIMRITTVFMIAALLSLIFYSNSHHNIVLFFTRHIPSSLFFYLILIFISESLKKSFDTLAQLSFLNQNIAIIQITMIISYVTMVWSSYFISGIITLNTIFMPMVISSYCELLLLAMIIYKHYQSLPTIIKQAPVKALAPQRSLHYINQVAKNLFSPNFLMIFISYNLGMSQAGDIRFFTNIITLLYMFFNRVIGMPSGALFSQIKKEPFKKIRFAFLRITNAYIQLLYFFAILIIAFIMPKLTNNSISIHVLFFVAIGFVEYITLTYEKLFIVQKQSNSLAVINSTSLFVLILVLIAFPLQTSWLLLPIFAVRLCSTIGIGYLSYNHWKILPKLSINLTTLGASLLCITISLGIQALI